MSTIDGLTNWVPYDVQVRGLNAGGPGPWSETETGTPSNIDVGLRLEWEDTSVDVNEDGGSVTLKAIAITDSDETLRSDFSSDATVTTEDYTATDPDDYAPRRDVDVRGKRLRTGDDQQRVPVPGYPAVHLHHRR